MELRYKYPRTPHLPWSPGASRDDVRLTSLLSFVGRRVVVTEKMDGECTTLYRDGLHARSISSGHHPSRSWVKGLQAQMGHLLPSGLRVCGENLYARHSVAYDSLPSYFLAFSAWRGDLCLSWDDTERWLVKLGLCSVPILWRGIFDERALRDLVPRGEGHVVRWEGAFDRQLFGDAVAKWVRAGHVVTDKHWMTSQVVPNGLAQRS